MKTPRHGRGGTHFVRERDNDRAAAIRAMTQGEQVIYAARLADGTIKIGCTGDLVARRRTLGSGTEILAFQFGDLDAERAIHSKLTAHRARAIEYYHPAPEVIAVVNDMRDMFNLPHIAA